MASWLSRLIGRPATEEYVNGIHGVDIQRWRDAEKAKARWSEYEKLGPEYAIPTKAVRCPEGIPSCAGTLYAAVYPATHFEDLLDFDMFQTYSSSIQQDLIQSGTLNRESFYPPSLQEGMTSLHERLGRLSRLDQLLNIKVTLEEMALPDRAGWVLDLPLSAWIVSWEADGLEAVGASEEGFLTLFALDDA